MSSRWGSFEACWEVIEIARRYHATNDDGHECPRDGSECDGCCLKDAIKALDRSTHSPKESG